MDPATLSVAIVAALGSLLGKGAEKFVEEFGKDAYQKAKDLLNRVRERAADSPKAEEALTAFERAPGPESEEALAHAVKEELVAAPDFASALIPLVRELMTLMEAAGEAESRYRVNARIVGAVGDGAQATFYLGEEKD